MTGLDGSYWNTIDVNSPRLRRRASTTTPFSSYTPPSPPKHPKRHPLKPLLKNKKEKDLSPRNHAPSPLKAVKEEKLVKREEETLNGNENDNVSHSWDQEKDTSISVQVKEEKKDDVAQDNSIPNPLNDTKIENGDEDDDYSEPFFDDVSIMSAIDAASVGDDDDGFYDEFSYNEDSNFGNEDFKTDSFSNAMLNQDNGSHIYKSGISNDNVEHNNSDEASNDNSQVIQEDATIPLLDTTNDGSDIINSDASIILDDDTHVLDDIDANTHNIINTSVDTTTDNEPAKLEQPKHKKKPKESNYIGLDGSYWSFTDTKRESVRRVSAYDLTLQRESIKRKKEFSSYEHEKERKKRRLAAQERLLKHGPRKPSQRSIEEKQRLIQQRLATMELNALEVVGAEVVPGLYVGSKYAARNLEWIKAAGVNYVVNCTPSTACNVAPGVVYHNISINDSPSEKDVLKKIIGNEVNYIATILSNPGNKILVHCNYGKSRSPTLVICYLIMALDWSLEDAYKKVDDCRKGISINIGFLQLIESIAEKACEKKKNREREVIVRGENE